MRCAVYARYSSDRQSPASIDDQIRKCREYAARQSWHVLEGHLYEDRAISGTLSDREGLKRLMAAAAEKAFDVVLVDDSSRLSRRVQDSLKLTDELKYHGIRLVCVSQNIDSDSEQGETLTVVHGLVDGLFVRELAAKTRRGLEGKALNRLHTGGRIFGYRSVPIEDPQRRDNYGRPLIAGARLEVDAKQAKTVRKIFSLYASGLSIKSVAKRMNSDGEDSPNPRAGRQHSWAPSSVRTILHNERYRGIVTWSRTKKVRNPQSGKKVRRARPESEWTRVEMPEQRIVPEKLWNAVVERRDYVTRVYGEQGRKGGLLRSRAASSPYIFSGFLKCGFCGGNFIVVSGVGYGHKTADYGCAAHFERGTCPNARRVPRDVVEKTLLAQLQRDVLSDAAIDYCVGRLEKAIEKRYAELDGEMDAIQKRKEVLEKELLNLGQAFATGFDSPTIRAEISKREKEVSDLVTKVASRKKGSVREQISGLRKFVKENLSDIRALLASKHANPALVRQELSRHVQGIVLRSVGEKIYYRGEWKVLGTKGSAVGGRGCAEGQNRTQPADSFFGTYFEISLAATA